jgi:hypothetical protein
MRRLLWASIVSGLLLTGATPEQEIRLVLERQVSDWNRGDIRGFMQGYEDSEGTTFVGTSITKGHSRVLAQYLTRYPQKENMGSLSFSDLEIKTLDDRHAYVIGKWKLLRSAAGGGDKGGIFTLVLRKGAAGWKIILDHTS